MRVGRQQRRWLTLAVLFVAGVFAVSGRFGVATAAAAPKHAAPPSGRKGAAPVDQFWARAKQEIYRSAEELAAQDLHERRKGLRYRKLIRGNPADRTVALTFDDGPHPQYTPKLLAILDRYGVRATFFVVGEMAAKYPRLIRAEKAAGHLIANHTYHHVNLTSIPISQIGVEWQACQDVIKAITGETMRYCRPPGGDYDRDVILAATELGLTTVLWTDDPGDYASPGDRTIETRVLDRISSGGIILLHDGVQQTVDVLPQIIERLQTRGFRLQTVADMRAENSARD